MVRHSLTPSGRSARRGGAPPASAALAPGSVLRGTAVEVQRRRAGLSHEALWLRYFELGGMRTPRELRAVLVGVSAASPHDADVLAHALDELLRDVGPGPAGAPLRSGLR